MQTGLTLLDVRLPPTFCNEDVAERAFSHCVLAKLVLGCTGIPALARIKPQ